MNQVDESTVPGELRARCALDYSVLQSILAIREDIGRRKTRFLAELRVRAGVPDSGLLNSLYLSLLDSCETSALEINFDVANQIKRQGNYICNILQDITQRITILFFCTNLLVTVLLEELNIQPVRQNIGKFLNLVDRK